MEIGIDHIREGIFFRAEVQRDRTIRRPEGVDVLSIFIQGQQEPILDDIPTFWIGGYREDKQYHTQTILRKEFERHLKAFTMVITLPGIFEEVSNNIDGPFFRIEDSMHRATVLKYVLEKRNGITGVHLAHRLLYASEEEIYYANKLFSRGDVDTTLILTADKTTD